jgi:hypothetical protein
VSSGRQHEMTDLAGDNIAEQERRFCAAPAADVLEPIVEHLHDSAARSGLAEDGILIGESIRHLR